jgi:hypothetical protein
LKIPVEGIKSWLDQAKKRISELNGRSFEITESRRLKILKRMKKKGKSLKDL